MLLVTRSRSISMKISLWIFRHLGSFMSSSWSAEGNLEEFTCFSGPFLVTHH